MKAVKKADEMEEKWVARTVDKKVEKRAVVKAALLVAAMAAL